MVIVLFQSCHHHIPCIGLLGYQPEHHLRLHDDLVLQCWYRRYRHHLSFHCQRCVSRVQRESWSNQCLIDAYTRYQSATGASVDAATGLLLISSAKYKALENLDFHIGSVRYFMSALIPLVHHFSQETYTLTPNAQIWPRSLNTYLGGSSSAIYLIIHDIGTPSGEGFDFVNGYTFLERFYSVYDTSKSRVGFAKTKYTDATTN
jgi:hypothetical protein